MTERLITIGEARARVLAEAKPLGAEMVPVEDALDRILLADLHAAADVPPFACSAMDGFAITAGAAGRHLHVIGESRAGTPAGVTISKGQAIRISTGAALPPGATAVIRQEDVVDVAAPPGIETAVDSPPGTNIRGPGEDMRAGTTALPAGTVLHAAELGAAVGAGVGEIAVARRPRVAIVCTGDELKAPGEPLGPGEIHNSNAPMLDALARHAGAETRPVRRLPDDRAATETGLADALEHADVVIVTGGVSVGPHDHVKPALARLGVEQRFWRVSLQPGKPTWFGVRDGTLVFGLPGNPVSAVVTFSLFAAPATAAMLGARPGAALDKEATLSRPVARNPTREQAIRVRLERADGRTIAIPNGPQGSHILSSLIGADALALIPPGDGELAAGTPVALERLAN